MSPPTEIQAEHLRRVLDRVAPFDAFVSRGADGAVRVETAGDAFVITEGGAADSLLYELEEADPATDPDDLSDRVIELIATAAGES